MATESDKTEVHTADNLVPAGESQASEVKLKKGEELHTVSIEGVVYSVPAKDAAEAADKAQEQHKSRKGE